LLHKESAASGSVPDPVKSLDDFEARAGSKIKTIVRILAHRFRQNHMPYITFNEDGSAEYPETSRELTLSGDEAKQKALVDYAHASSRKAIIFQFFVSMTPFVQSCLEVNGMRSVVVNGTMSFEGRAEAVEHFKRDPEVRVLILSAVGGVGLNLAFADIVIFAVSDKSVLDVLRAKAVPTGSAMEQAGHRASHRPLRANRAGAYR
jgi:SNF2 family DNA or RNA helicase